MERKVRQAGLGRVDHLSTTQTERRYAQGTPGTKAIEAGVEAPESTSEGLLGRRP